MSVIENCNNTFMKIKKILELPQQDKLRYRKQYPSRNQFKFDQGISVSSNFDSGNL